MLGIFMLGEPYLGQSVATFVPPPSAITILRFSAFVLEPALIATTRTVGVGFTATERTVEPDFIFTQIP